MIDNNSVFEWPSKTKTTKISPANHNQSKQSDKPIKITCKLLKAREKSRVEFSANQRAEESPSRN